jgi:glycosyltransferase involved in cell wall biosynthesis
MTVGFFSPLPPARTGVADYSASLLRGLQAHGRVEVNAGDADVCLYHLGNNQLHREMYERALERPGVAVLHDAVLQHFFLGSLNERQYIEEFVCNYGRWSEGVAEILWRNRARSGSDPLYFRYPMLKRIAERSRAVVVHNTAAARMVCEHAPDAHILEIPHLYEPGPQPEPYEVERLRAALQVAPSTFLFGVFGHLRESKRLTTVLRAFERLRVAGERVALLVAGEFASSDLERAMTHRLAGAGVRRVGYTPELTFNSYARAVDACVNLRYPTAGETSGIAIRLMGAGKPVLFTAGEETADIPANAAVRVDAGPGELDMLTEYMLWMARFPRVAEAMGSIARRHVEEKHALPRVAEMYWRVLSESRG